MHLVLRLRGGCFTADTLVLMADGSYAAIESICVGDMVASVSDELEGSKHSASRVLQTYQHNNAAHEIVELHLSDGSVLTCTAGHPFATSKRNDVNDTSDIDAVAESHVWAAVDPTQHDGSQLKVRALKVGDVLVAHGSDPQSSLSVCQITTSPYARRTFNFEVANTHAYFVAASTMRTTERQSTFVLVHNNSGGPLPVPPPILDDVHGGLQLPRMIDGSVVGRARANDRVPPGAKRAAGVAVRVTRMFYGISDDATIDFSRFKRFLAQMTFEGRMRIMERGSLVTGNGTWGGAANEPVVPGY